MYIRVDSSFRALSQHRNRSFPKHLVSRPYATIKRVGPKSAVLTMSVRQTTGIGHGWSQYPALNIFRVVDRALLCITMTNTSSRV